MGQLYSTQSEYLIPKEYKESFACMYRHVHVLHETITNNTSRKEKSRFKNRQR